MIWLKKTDICNFADDTTFHPCDSSLNFSFKRLEHDSNLAVEWFDSNYMKLNQDRCHLRISVHKFETIWAKIGETQICKGKEQKLI